MFKVTVTEKDGQASSYNFDALKSEISIGRVKGNDIVLPKGNVSKRHSRIVVKDGKFIVVDLKSTNGTFVNGRKIARPQVIKTEDKVYIGDFVLSVAEEAGQDNTGPIHTAGPSPSSSGLQPLSGSNLSGLGPAAPAGPPPMAPPGPPPMAPPGPPMAPPGPPVAPPGPATAPPGPSSLAPPARPAPGRLSSPGLASLDSNRGPGPGNTTSSPTLPPRHSGGGLAPRNTTPSMPSAPQRPSSPGMAAAPAAVSSASQDDVTPLPGPAPVAPMASAASVARPAPVEPAPMPAATGMPSLQTPGAGAVVPRPRFVYQRDDAFADVQARAAEAFFASVDPRELPTHYPPAPEDRQRFEGLARDAAGRAGAGNELAEHILAEIVGLGPLEGLLDDPSVEEIYVNSYEQILYKQEGRVVAAPRAYSHPDFLYLAAQRLLAGRLEDPDALPVEEVRFSDGTRVTITMPPLAPNGPALVVRKHRSQVRSLEDLVNAGSLSHGMAQVLTQAVEAGRNILVAGPRHSGRVELLNALAALIPDGSRVAVVEDAPGVQLNLHSAVRLETSTTGGANYDLRYLVGAAMRMQPDRIVLNSLSGAEAYDWVTAAAAGTLGSMAVGHGVNALDALDSVTTLAQLGAPGLSASGLRQQVARAVHLIAITHRDAQGALRVQQIAELQGVDLEHYRVHDIFYFRAEGAGGQFTPTGYVPMFYEALRSAGMSVDNSIFNP